MEAYKVTFHPSGRSITVDEGENLLQAAMEAGVHINASWGGSTTCGKCKIKITGGAADSPMDAKLSPAEYEEGYRLACLTSIRGDLDVEIPPESQVDKSALALKGDREQASYLLSPKDIYQLVQGWDVDPTVFKKCGDGPAPPRRQCKRSDASCHRHKPPARHQRDFHRLPGNHEIESHPQGGGLEGDRNARSHAEGLQVDQCRAGSRQTAKLFHRRRHRHHYHFRSTTQSQRMQGGRLSRRHLRRDEALP